MISCMTSKVSFADPPISGYNHGRSLPTTFTLADIATSLFSTRMDASDIQRKKYQNFKITVHTGKQRYSAGTDDFPRHTVSAPAAAAKLENDFSSGWFAFSRKFVQRLRDILHHSNFGRNSHFMHFMISCPLPPPPTISILSEERRQCSLDDQ